MYTSGNATLTCWLLCGALVLLAGCPAGKEQSAAQSGVAPGEKIAVTPQVAEATPTAPPAPPPPQELTVTTFAVTGMTCDDCSASIEAKLIKLPGVTTVAADYKTGVAKVQYDPQQSPVAKLIEAIDSLGFKAKETSTSSAKPPQPVVGAADAAPATKAPGEPAAPAPGAGK
jgi:copper chaperone CopZ